MKSILVVEDDSTLRRVLKDNFESRGFDVDAVVDGETGLVHACRGSYDVILLDVMLPGANGFEICQQIRERNIQTPVVMLTAKGQEDDVIRGLELGADDYITKPFSIRELAARVNVLIRRLGPQDGLIRFGDCELNLDAHTLSREGELVPLTTKEFRLLALFASRPGRAFTRNEILSRVWGQSVIVTTRSVDRCVTTLRAKIEADPKQPQWVTTVRDIGYRFGSG